MRIKVIYVWLSVALPLSVVQSLNVLIVVPTVSKSHWIFASSIGKSLAEANHQVTLMSAYPLQTPIANYRDIHLSGLIELMDGTHRGKEGLAFFGAAPYLIIFRLKTYGCKIVEFIFSHPNVKQLMENKNEYFDLIIVEQFETDSLIAFGQYYNAPVIGYTTFSSSNFIKTIGNPAPSSYVPHLFTRYTDSMTFGQRFVNALYSIFEFSVNEFIFFKKHEKVYQKYFPNAEQEYFEIYKKGVSLMFTNSHSIINVLKPILPNTIEIGGIHIKNQTTSLPDDLKQFIESAEEGIIFFSLGSNIKNKHLSKDMQETFLKVFSKLKEKVIWKFDLKGDENIPTNVFVSNWVSQQEILSYNKTKLFISHGGIFGLMESVYAGVPVIGIPIFADQYQNMMYASRYGWGHSLDLYSLTDEKILDAIKTILSNKSYSDNIKKVSTVFRDRPKTPKETVVFWVEYVARHKGALFLQGGGQDLNFFEYHMIDVFVFIFIIICIVSLCIGFIIFRLGNFFYRKIVCKSKTKTA